eukprot:394070-Prymnesium_polylepis.1
MRTCTYPSRGQSSEAIIYGVTQIAFFSSTVPERKVAPPQSDSSHSSVRGYIPGSLHAGCLEARKPG